MPLSRLSEDVPNYKVQLKVKTPGQRGKSIKINAYTPDTFQLSVQAEWEAKLAGTFGDLAESAAGRFGSIISTGVKAGSAFSGKGGATLKAQTWQSWLGSSPIEINLVLLFNADTDAHKDVVNPMAQLASLALPIEQNGILIPPGPEFSNPDSSTISLAVGNLLLIPRMVLVSVGNTFDTKYDIAGQPISGQLEVTLRTIDTPSRNEFLRYFNNINFTFIRD